MNTNEYQCVEDRAQLYNISKNNWEILIMENSQHRASFNPITSCSVDTGRQEIIEQECKKILTNGEAVEITEVEHQFVAFPYLLRLIFSLYYSLSKKSESISQDSTFLSSPFTTHVKYSLLKLVTSMIEKRLFVSSDSQKYYDQVSFSLLFKQCLFNLFISLLSENTNFVIFERIITFYRTLVSQQYQLYLPIQIYHLYGGGAFTIESRVFREKLTAMIEGLGRALSSTETIINRNIEHYKSNPERKLLLEESIKIVMLAKNKQGLTEVTANITKVLFAGRDYLKKEEFLYQLQTKPLDSILIMPIQLVRSQAMLIEQRSFQASLVVRNETSKSNFYTNQIAKLFNKCPFNGDERCDCKKCQCVRRNRESAKLSQQKKRNAVEQVEQMKQRLTELEESDRLKNKKIRELQEENMMLKSLMKEMRQNPNMKSLMMQTIEPVSKILNNEL